MTTTTTTRTSISTWDDYTTRNTTKLYEPKRSWSTKRSVRWGCKKNANSFFNYVLFYEFWYLFNYFFLFRCFGVSTLLSTNTSTHTRTHTHTHKQRWRRPSDKQRQQLRYASAHQQLKRRNRNRKWNANDDANFMMKKGGEESTLSPQSKLWKERERATVLSWRFLSK